MKISQYQKPIALLAIGLFTNCSNAATSYFSEAHLSLEIISYTDSSGTEFDFFSPPTSIEVSSFDNSFDINQSTSASGDAYADAVSTPFADSGLIDLDVQASGYSGLVYSYAQSDALASGGFELVNSSSTDAYTVNMLLNYAYSGAVETDTPADEQNGMATVDIDLFGDFSLPQILSISEITELGLDSFSNSAADIAVSFLLGTNETETIFASLFSYGESESIAVNSVNPVPAPTPLVLIASALMTFSIRRKKLAYN